MPAKCVGLLEHVAGSPPVEGQALGGAIRTLMPGREDPLAFEQIRVGHQISRHAKALVEPASLAARVRVGPVGRTARAALSTIAAVHVGLPICRTQARREILRRAGVQTELVAVPVAAYT